MWLGRRLDLTDPRALARGLRRLARRQEILARACGMRQFAVAAETGAASRLFTSLARWDGARLFARDRRSVAGQRTGACSPPSRPLGWLDGRCCGTFLLVVSALFSSQGAGPARARHRRCRARGTVSGPRVERWRAGWTYWFRDAASPQSPGRRPSRGHAGAISAASWRPEFQVLDPAGDSPHRHTLSGQGALIPARIRHRPAVSGRYVAFRVRRRRRRNSRSPRRGRAGAAGRAAGRSRGCVRWSGCAR